MKYFILLQAFLVCATSGQVPTLLENVEFPGNDIEMILAPDAECCQIYCTVHFRCTFFTFILENRGIPSFFCLLKYTDNGFPSRSVTSPNVVSGFRLATVDPNKHSCFTKTYKDIDFLGSDIMYLLRETLTECQDSCTDSPDCQFFTYYTEQYNAVPKARKMCFHKFATKLPSPPVINILDNVVSGFSPRDCDDSTCDSTCPEYLIPNFDFNGEDFDLVLAPDAENCQLICSNHPHCQYFTFFTEEWTADDRKFFCYLKRSDPRTSSLVLVQNVISGFSLRRFGIKKRCSDHIFKGLNFLGNDRGVVKADSDQQCKQLCKDDPLCQFFTFVDGDFSNIAQRNDCHMKSMTALPKPPLIRYVKDVVSEFSRIP
ncbi:coagulation factor XI-like [Lissotriton helveticus]